MKKNMYDTIISAIEKKCLVCPLRERLSTPKVFTKDKCFYLYYHKFSIKSYVLDVY